MSRIHYRVLSDGGRWKVSRSENTLAHHQTQEAAIADARQRAKRDHDAGHLTQLTIQGRNGAWRTEWTYGHDPRRYPG